MKTKTVKVNLRGGLDARGVALSVQTASRFQSQIILSDGVRRMNAKSLMGMMALGVALGDEVVIEANGADEEEALNAMETFLEGK
ncbi:MAG: HPr family phosphocarrier protein [Lachnospiraceae bacterium]|nr:HPr family phosphocarrier protein [Lachnospiraceae bacterium]MBR5680233.1 HPr family phosphocarrier protein [Clostridia bacterium]MBR5738823.1 HPr family phosphocarrier protein [Lachnospiraceae bacterium]